MTLREKASYIKGLVEGFDLDKDKKENKALLSVVDLLDDMAGSISELENRMDDATDQVEDMADDLDDISRHICKCHDDGECHHCDSDCSDEDLFYEIKCPACNTTICLPESKVIENDINCPNCGQDIDIEVSDFDSDSSETDYGNHTDDNLNPDLESDN